MSKIGAVALAVIVELAGFDEQVVRRREEQAAHPSSSPLWVTIHLDTPGADSRRGDISSCFYLVPQGTRGLVEIRIEIDEASEEQHASVLLNTTGRRTEADCVAAMAHFWEFDPVLTSATVVFGVTPNP